MSFPSSSLTLMLTLCKPQGQKCYPSQSSKPQLTKFNILQPSFCKFLYYQKRYTEMKTVKSGIKYFRFNSPKETLQVPWFSHLKCLNFLSLSLWH